ncbi:MAG: hypothetical protein JHC81_04735 [Brevundimonas sp.]|uniref:hypothetical protein n=1 Tax=Brevundimonas sp. TaxID=1871086 RepID=UPI001A19FC87|nr:hypothetical protein [Brevundimonas sp.]MBJ7446820.1 hypothetical protein [Brevundimonas sp.]
MRPPWSEATALIGAAGFSPPPPNYRPSIWSRHAMQSAPFAILPRLDAVTKPIVFPDANALAAYIERSRGGQGLDMTEVEDLHFLWRAEGGGADVDPPAENRDRGVQVWTTMLDGSRDRCLGWAWLNGGGLEVLKAALRRASMTATSRTASGPIGDSSPLQARRAYARLRANGWVGPREAYVPQSCVGRA